MKFITSVHRRMLGAHECVEMAYITVRRMELSTAMADGEGDGGDIVLWSLLRHL